ncbi:MAG: DUF4296 domain-containing protein [Bacteroidia bacterium]
MKPPKDVLGKQEMIALLVDIHLAEALGYMERINNLEKQELLSSEYAVVLNKHSVSKELLEKSYNWYLENPLVFENMYDEIIEQIKAQEQFANDPNEIKKEDEEMPEEIPAGEIIEINKPLLPPKNVTN